MSPDPCKDLSLIIPVYNEEENLRALWEEITTACQPLQIDYEIIFVDDGSSDRSVPLIQELHTADPDHVMLIQFRRNAGQTAAFAAGFDYAQGAVVITLDADRQNDPADIPTLYYHLIESDYDVVNGWRQNRQDGFLLRKLPSRIANKLIATTTGVKLKDRGCSMRAFRLEVVRDLHLYGELHRFIPELVDNAGYTMTEVAVNHRPRVAGESKYGLSRTFRVLLDLSTVLFLRNYGDRPMHLFGKLALYCGFFGFLLAFWLTMQKVWAGITGGWAGFHAFQIGERPLLLLGVLLIIVGVQFLVAGLTAELIIRTYYETQDKPVYRLKKIMPTKDKEQRAKSKEQI